MVYCSRVTYTFNWKTREELAYVYQNISCYLESKPRWRYWVALHPIAVNLVFYDFMKLAASSNKKQHLLNWSIHALECTLK